MGAGPKAGDGAGSSLLPSSPAGREGERGSERRRALVTCSEKENTGRRGGKQLGGCSPRVELSRKGYFGGLCGLFSHGRSALHPFPRKGRGAGGRGGGKSGHKSSNRSGSAKSPGSQENPDQHVHHLLAPAAAILTVFPPSLKSFKNTSGREEGRAKPSHGEGKGKRLAQLGSRSGVTGKAAAPLHSSGAYLGSFPSGTGGEDAQSRAGPGHGEGGSRNLGEGEALRPPPQPARGPARQPARRRLPHSSSSLPRAGRPRRQHKVIDTRRVPQPKMTAGGWVSAQGEGWAASPGALVSVCGCALACAPARLGPAPPGRRRGCPGAPRARTPRAPAAFPAGLLLPAPEPQRQRSAVRAPEREVEGAQSPRSFPGAADRYP